MREGWLGCSGGFPLVGGGQGWPWSKGWCNMVRKDLPDWGTVAFPGGELGESIEIFFLGRSSVLEKHFPQSVPPFRQELCFEVTYLQGKLAEPWIDTQVIIAQLFSAQHTLPSTGRIYVPMSGPSLARLKQNIQVGSPEKSAPVCTAGQPCLDTPGASLSLSFRDSLESLPRDVPLMRSF